MDPSDVAVKDTVSAYYTFSTTCWPRWTLVDRSDSRLRPTPIGGIDLSVGL